MSPGTSLPFAAVHVTAALRYEADAEWMSPAAQLPLGVCICYHELCRVAAFVPALDCIEPQRLLFGASAADHTFTSLERDGWSRNAAGYDNVILDLTSQAFGPVLDTFGDLSERRFLDVASGTGHLAKAAADRGAAAEGLDISPEMVACAARAFPALTFRTGNADALPYDGRNVRCDHLLLWPPAHGATGKGRSRGLSRSAARRPLQLHDLAGSCRWRRRCSNSPKPRHALACWVASASRRFRVATWTFAGVRAGPRRSNVC